MEQRWSAGWDPWTDGPKSQWSLRVGDIGLRQLVWAPGAKLGERRTARFGHAERRDQRRHQPRMR
jgi:hypothetical protein